MNLNAQSLERERVDIEEAMTKPMSLAARAVMLTRLRKLEGLATATLNVKLRDGARVLQRTMLALDEEEFVPLRRALTSGALLPHEFEQALKGRSNQEKNAYAERLLGIQHWPPNAWLRPEMREYLPSNVITAIELARRVKPDDVLYDVGSGLGLVPMVVSWFSGARTVGVEFNPDYAELAEASREALGFSRVRVIEADALSVNYEEASCVYLYTPFEGGMMADFLEHLGRNRHSALRVFAYGPCVEVLNACGWLKRAACTASGMIEYEPI